MVKNNRVPGDNRSPQLNGCSASFGRWSRVPLPGFLGCRAAIVQRDLNRFLRRESPFPVLWAGSGLPPFSERADGV